jgi:hypothetical protein
MGAVSLGTPAQSRRSWTQLQSSGAPRLGFANAPRGAPLEPPALFYGPWAQQAPSSDRAPASTPARGGARQAPAVRPKAPGGSHLSHHGLVSAPAPRVRLMSIRGAETAVARHRRPATAPARQPSKTQADATTSEPAPSPAGPGRGAAPRAGRRPRGCALFAPDEAPGLAAEWRGPQGQPGVAPALRPNDVPAVTKEWRHRVRGAS